MNAFDYARHAVSLIHLSSIMFMPACTAEENALLERDRRVAQYTSVKCFFFASVHLCSTEIVWACSWSFMNCGRFS